MKINYLRKIIGVLLAVSCSSLTTTYASDHDDGSQALSTNNLNLTDLFTFREDNQTAVSTDNKNLILIMNSNGHTPPGTQVFFNPSGRYEFHITRVTSDNLNATPTGKDDVLLRVEFGEPDASQHQITTLTAVRDGVRTPASETAMITTSLAEGMAGTMKENTATIAGNSISLFAGLREDPFYFDVEQFFKVRAGAAGAGPLVGFRTSDKAVDGFAKQNVNSIVLRVPISFLQTAAAEPVFDVWVTTSLR